MRMARLLGHDQQRVQRQDRDRRAAGTHPCTQRQALCHGAGGAQAGEGARTPSEHDGVELGQRQVGLGQQRQDRRHQGA